MPTSLTAPQLQALKTYLVAQGNLSDEQLRDRCNEVAVGPYWVWKTSFTRSDVYHTTGPDGTVWDWATYKAQAVAEQNAWTQMFMGDSAPVGRVNFRQGVAAIFSGTGAAQVAQRNHIFSVGRKQATNAEKVLALQVANPPVNTGNNAAQPRGASANPDNLGYENPITIDDVVAALS